MLRSTPVQQQITALVTNNFDCFMHTQAAGSFSARLRVGDSGSDTDKETYAVAHGDLA
jgi:hypothetical protein